MTRRDGHIGFYQNYDDLKFTVVATLMRLIERTKGNILTFTAKKIAVHAGLPPQPVILTLIKDVLENLCREGLISRYSRTSHGTKYIVTQNSALWRAAKDSRLIYTIRTPYLETVIARMQAP